MAARQRVTNMQKQIRRKLSLSYIMSEYGAFIAFFLLFAINAVFTRNFLKMQTVWNILTQSVTSILLGLGMTVVIATGGINISVGSGMAMTAMVSAIFIARGQIALGLLLGLLVGVLFGAITGFIVIKLKIQPMIVSLSMMFVMRGIAKLINDGRVMSYRNRAFTDFFFENAFGVVPVRVVIWLAMAFILWVILSKTRFGNYIEAYGDNPDATYISGVNVVSVVTAAYVICNIFAFAAGIIEAGYATTVDPGSMGVTKEMDAIAATVVGGTSISGGKPKVWGTVFGALVLQLITIMVNMNNIPVAYARIIKAAIIIAAICLQRLKDARG